jgi:excisionase family DNA binding protein
MAHLMNIEELADYLRLNKQTIYNWLHSGKFSGIKIGGVWRFDKRQVDLWLKERHSSKFKSRSSLKEEPQNKKG